MKSSDEAQLVTEAKQGNQVAFAELAYRYRTAAYAAAYIRLRDHHDAEDVAQDALLTAYEKISNLVDPHKFGAWLCSLRSAVYFVNCRHRRPESNAPPNAKGEGGSTFASSR